MFFEAADDARIVCIACGCARIDDDIDCRQFVLVSSKRFTYQALDAVATHRAPDDTRCNRESEARHRGIVGASEDPEESIAAAAGIAIDAIKGGFLPESLRRGERPRAGLQVRRARRFERSRA
jgi:hypothetical protein